MNLASTPEILDAIKAWFDEVIAGVSHRNVANHGWTLDSDGTLTFTATVQVTTKQMQQLSTLALAERAAQVT